MRPLTIEVTLLSGKRVSLEAGADESVESLKKRARKALAIGRATLLDSSGRVLDAASTLEECSLQSGDTLTLQRGSVRVHGHKSVLAAILGDGSGVTWGYA